jgi:Short C-terminal domain
MFGPSRRVARRTSRRTSRRMMRRQDAMYGDDGGYDEPQQAAPAPAAPAEPSDTEQLTELAKLHDQGILTDEEFAAKKKEILDI